MDSGQRTLTPRLRCTGAHHSSRLGSRVQLAQVCVLALLMVASACIEPACCDEDAANDPLNLNLTTLRVRTLTPSGHALGLVEVAALRNGRTVAAGWSDPRGWLEVEVPGSDAVDVVLTGRMHKSAADGGGWREVALCPFLAEAKNAKPGADVPHLRAVRAPSIVRLTIRVLDSEGTPAQDIEVQLRSRCLHMPGGDVITSRRTNDKGEAHFHDLAAVPLYAAVAASWAASEPVRVDPGTTELDIRLRPGTSRWVEPQTTPGVILADVHACSSSPGSWSECHHPGTEAFYVALDPTQPRRAVHIVATSQKGELLTGHTIVGSPLPASVRVTLDTPPEAERLVLSLDESEEHTTKNPPIVEQLVAQGESAIPFLCFTARYQLAGPRAHGGLFDFNGRRRRWALWALASILATTHAPSPEATQVLRQAALSLDPELHRVGRAAGHLLGSPSLLRADTASVQPTLPSAGVYALDDERTAELTAHGILEDLLSREHTLTPWEHRMRFRDVERDARKRMEDMFLGAEGELHLKEDGTFRFVLRLRGRVQSQRTGGWREENGTAILTPESSGSDEAESPGGMKAAQVGNELHVDMGKASRLVFVAPGARDSR